MPDVSPIYRLAGQLGITTIFVGDSKTKLLANPKYHLDRKGYVDWKPWITQGVHVISPPQLQSAWMQQQLGGGPGNGSRGGGGAGAPMPGQVAANANVKAFTGGGTQNIGATNIAGAGIAVIGEFMGANFQTADTKQPEGMSPDTMNMEGMGMGGALSPRPGLIALWPKRNDTSNVVTAAYGGRSINILSPAFNQSHHMTVISAYDRSSLIGTSLNSTVVARVKRMKPLWHPQHDVSKVLPKIKLTDSNATGGIAFNVSMPVTYRKNAPQVASVDQMIVRVSRTTYPRDRDGKDDTASRLASNASAYNYVTYDGTSTVVTDRCSMVSTGATVYYSVWVASKLHVTPRASFRLVVK